jgi:hypothetical protein
VIGRIPKLLSTEEYDRRLVFARQEAVKAWCTEETSGKEMDVFLAEAFAKILVEHMYEPHMGCATTGELIDEIKARSNLDYKTVSDL